MPLPTSAVLTRRALAVLVLASLLTCRAWPQAQEPQRPNFVFILADDLGWKDLSGEGSTFYRSPNLDRLAQQGMRFRRGYAACQVCSPSRASILTGKYPTRHGITDWIGAAAGKDWRRNDRLLPASYQRQLAAEHVTLAEALREHGYRTFCAGKWHLGGAGSLPTDHGFDFNAGGFAAGSPRGGYFAPYNNPQLADGPAGEALPWRLAQETVKFIEQQRDQPFFAYLAFYSVHSPLQTTQALWDKYRQRATERPHDGPRFLVDRTLPVRQVQDHPVYGGMVEAMDQAVGDVLDALERLGLDQRTVVIFTSDNGGVSSGDGYATSNLPLRGGKGRQWEGGLREPFYIKAPGRIEPGSQCDVPVSGIDFFATILDLAAVPLPREQPIDGVSLTPLFGGGQIQPRPLFWHYPHYGNQGGEPSSIILRHPWKLIHYWEDGRDELYNLEYDPGERSSMLKENVDQALQLRQELDQWLEATGAQLPSLNPRFNPLQREQQDERTRNQLLPRMEQQHAAFLNPDWRPNTSWWGSGEPQN